jgi:hypothetical protein
VKRVAIIQPNYIPWKGYFDIIHAVDVFIFLDDVQYTQRDWRNRNRIKLASGGSTWLTVPTLGGRSQSIHEVRIDRTQDWPRKHAQALRHSYARTPFFERYHPRFVEIVSSSFERLADLDIALTKQICEWLGIERELRRSSEMGGAGTKDERLVDLAQEVAGDSYLSGPAARDYIVPKRFEDAGIALRYHDYAGYAAYPQISAPFDHYVTVLDLLFAIGPDAPDYVWGSRTAKPIPVFE